MLASNSSSSSSSSSSSILPTSSLPLDLKINPTSSLLASYPLSRSPTTQFHSPFDTSPNSPTPIPSPLSFGNAYLGQKFRIQSLKEKPIVPPDFESKTWAILVNALQCILKQEKPLVSLETLYRACKALCQHHLNHALYEQLSMSLKLHCESLLPPLLSLTHSMSTNFIPFLTSLFQCWKTYSASLKLICQIFLYLDRVHVLPQHQTGLWELGLEIFRRHVLVFPTDLSFSNASSSFSSSSSSSSSSSLTSLSSTSSRTLGEHAIQAFIHLINYYRSLYFPSNVPAWSLSEKYSLDPTHPFNEVDLTLLHRIKECAHMFDLLTIYHTKFYSFFSNSTLAFYRPLIQSWLSSSASSSSNIALDTKPTTPDMYLALCNGVFALETHLQHHLPNNDASSVCSLILKDCIASPHAFILSGLPNWLLPQPNTLALTLLYSFFVKVDLLSQLRSSYFTWLISEGQKAFQSLDAVSIVNQLLHLKQTLDVVLPCFQHHECMVSATKEAFLKFMNLPHHKPAECLAMYLDGILKSKKTGSLQELEKLLDQVILLFKHLQGKDVFAAFYKTCLSKRLLSGKTTSMDAEHSMLLRLRQECGKEFTESLEKMLQDVSLSKEFTTAFAQSKWGGQLSMEVNVLVCQDAVWPPMDVSVPPLPLRLPSLFTSTMQQYEAFYKHQHTGRTLTWQHEVGYLILKAFHWQSKELSLPFLSGLILLAFNQQPTYTYLELEQTTGIQDAKVLTKALHALILCKPKLLLHSSSPSSSSSNTQVPTTATTTTFSPTTVFSLPPQLDTPKFRITVYHVKSKEMEDFEAQKTSEKVQEDRVAVLDATIVRILKAQKKLTHAALFSEVVKVCKFPVESGSFKKRIESLMERDYLERDESQVNMYKYIA